MKQIYFLLSLFMSVSFAVTAQVALPVDFEDATVTYDFAGFEGADSALEANPDTSGENTSATVIRTTKTDGAQFFAGTLLNLDTAIDFSEGTVITVQTWSPKADIPVRFALENQTTGNQITVDVNTTVDSAWETLSFDFDGQINDAIDYNRVVIFFEFIDGLLGDGSTYYYDTIAVTAGDGGGGDPVELPVTFDNEDLNYDFMGFEGANSTRIANPDTSGENTSASVIETIKTEGAQFFAGTFVNLDTPIAFADDMGAITIQTWSPKADIPVRLRLENSDNSAGIELDVNTTVDSAWETLTYDFSGVFNADVDYVRAVVFFEFIDGLAGDGSTYYFDTIELAAGDGGGGADPVALPVTFDDTDLNYDFAGFEGAASSLIANPDMSGENTSASVIETIKTEGAQFFAGTFVNLGTPVAFTDDMGTITVQTWSPKADIPVRVRLENADNSSGIELDVITTVTNTWETLTYDFSSVLDQSVEYTKVVVFFEFVDGLAGDGSTYYFDTIELKETLSVGEFSAVQLTAFPNPTLDHWNFTANTPITQVEIYDLAGKRVSVATPDSTTATVNATALQSGLYIAKITTAQGVQSVKLLKN